ncbi:MAG: carboxypeptidase regulatory-like domain-containing protein [Bacteroidetes bacterium]|nr:carboxypeptidase regulatory-like domain-containing protein [Bacteroidota bacterium]
MNSQLIARLKMYQVMADLLSENAEITQTLPGFPDLLLTLQQKIGLLKEDVKNQSGNTNGIAYAKKKDRDELIKSALELSRKITAYASMNGNELLSRNSKISHSTLSRKLDHELAGYCLNLCESALTMLEQLQPYSVTEEEVKAIKQLADEFFYMIPKPKEAKNQLKQSHDSVKRLISETDVVLKKMDILLQILRNTNSGFYEKYLAARKIFLHGGKKISMKGIVKDARTQTGLSGVVVEFTHPNGGGNGYLEVILKKKTSSLGGFTIQSLEAGTYQAVASKAGYESQTLPVFINDGELFHLNFNLNPL